MSVAAKTGPAGAGPADLKAELRRGKKKGEAKEEMENINRKEA